MVARGGKQQPLLESVSNDILYPSTPFSYPKRRKISIIYLSKKEISHIEAYFFVRPVDPLGSIFRVPVALSAGSSAYLNNRT